MGRRTYFNIDGDPIPPEQVVDLAILKARRTFSWRHFKDTVKFLRTYYPCRDEHSENHHHYTRLLSFIKGQGWYGVLPRLYGYVPECFKECIVETVFEAQIIYPIIQLGREANLSGDLELRDRCFTLAILLGARHEEL